MLNVELLRVGRKEEYVLKFNYDPELIELIKGLPREERDYAPTTKLWTLDAWGLFKIIKQYKGREDIFFQFPSDKDREQFKKIAEKKKLKIEEKKKEEATRKEFEIELANIKANLRDYTGNIDYSLHLKEGVKPYPFQGDGAYFISKINKGILAMDLGTGKTITSILACQMNPDIKKVLCIVPASLKLNWQNEVREFTNENAYVYNIANGKLKDYKRNNGLELKDCKYVIINYDYFRSASFDVKSRVKAMGMLDCDTIIFDEAHVLGNSKTNTAKNIKESFDKVIKRRILLTGTPVKNKLINLFPLLKMVKPEEFSNQSKFYVEYCGLRYDPWGYGWVEDDKNPPRLEDLNKRLETLMFRVKKEDVLKDLPDKVKNKIIVEMTEQQAKDYSLIEAGLKRYDMENDEVIDTGKDDKNEAIVIIQRLRMFTASLKVKAVYDLIKELNDNDEKVVIFDAFKKPLKQLHALLGDNSALYTGDQNIDTRQELVDVFQNPDSSLRNLLISLQAGNAGITLTQAKNLILITESYVPSDNEQCYARIHRIGQKNSVNIFICIVDQTIDELIYKLVDEKQKMIMKVIDNLDYDDSVNHSVVDDLIKAIAKKRR